MTSPRRLSCQTTEWLVPQDGIGSIPFNALIIVSQLRKGGIWCEVGLRSTKPQCTNTRSVNCSERVGCSIFNDSKRNLRSYNCLWKIKGLKIKHTTHLSSFTAKNQRRENIMWLNHSWKPPTPVQLRSSSISMTPPLPLLIILFSLLYFHIMLFCVVQAAIQESLLAQPPK